MREFGMRVVAAALLLATLTGCGGLLRSDRDEAMLAVHQSNALDYYDSGNYAQALDQTRRALELEADLPDMKLVQGFCLLKIGKANRDASQVDEALEIFTGLRQTSLLKLSGEPSYQVEHALGRAHLARALMHDDAIAHIEQRLSSEYLAGDARAADGRALKREHADRLEHLNDAVRHLQTVTNEPRGDTAHARIDLVLALNSLGGRDSEMLSNGRTALKQLEQTNRYWRNIQANGNSSAESKVGAELQVENNLKKEAMLRDLIATLHYNRGETEAYLAELAEMEARQLMTAVQHFNRAEIWEQRGRYDLAIADLEAFLRMRGQHMTFEQDDRAAQVFRRIDALRSRLRSRG